ncbi:MAG: tRNA (guanosine(46)-N7)-methyltransferase TrmB [Candidatus Omnitrophica bacterium]|nr:tRNA (guanosine(46)-N7)-methyltransferase TrmB [Candidatus Omnitrophota bacterium]
MKNNYEHGSLDSYLDVDSLTFPLDCKFVFGNDHPLDIEIGFGTGEYLIRLASAEPLVNFIGFDQAPKRVIKTLRKIHQGEAKNIRVLELDAVWGFEYLLMSQSVRKVHCLFPCPWPKKRHAKHRLFQSQVLKLINNRLEHQGILRIVTDQKPYVEWIMEQLADTGFEAEQSIVGPAYQTKFEKKWQAAGQEEFYALDLHKNKHIQISLKEMEPVRTYFAKEFFPDQVSFVDQSGPVTIKFHELIYDSLQKKGMVHAIITEDRKTQYLWIMIVHTTRGWCVGAAPGTAALPTEGVRKAIALAYEAVEQSKK